LAEGLEALAPGAAVAEARNGVVGATCLIMVRDGFPWSFARLMLLAEMGNAASNATKE
jgi:hypothetical protein